MNTTQVPSLGKLVDLTRMNDIQVPSLGKLVNSTMLQSGMDGSMAFIYITSSTTTLDIQ